MNIDVLKVIPRAFRAKGCLVTLTIFVRALLNFVGLAALLPVLYLILDIDAVHTNPIAQRVYDGLGFTSDRYLGFESRPLRADAEVAILCISFPYAIALTVATVSCWRWPFFRRSPLRRFALKFITLSALTTPSTARVTLAPST